MHKFIFPRVKDREFNNFVTQVCHSRMIWIIFIISLGIITSCFRFIQVLFFQNKVRNLKHLLISNRSKQEICKTTVCLYGLYCVFPLNTLLLTSRQFSTLLLFGMPHKGQPFATRESHQCWTDFQTLQKLPRATRDKYPRKKQILGQDYIRHHTANLCARDLEARHANSPHPS